MGKNLCFLLQTFWTYKQVIMSKKEAISDINKQITHFSIRQGGARCIREIFLAF